MLLLYLKFFDPKRLSSEQIQESFLANSQPTSTELETKSSADLVQKKLNEKIQQTREVYALERRFLW